MSAPLVMLHLGLGFFHRAHQALYLHRLIEIGRQQLGARRGQHRGPTCRS